MKRLFQFAALTLLPLLLLGAECERRPVDPTAAGGASATGGSASTGGQTAVAGAPAQTGGASTGGATATQEERACANMLKLGCPEASNQSKCSSDMTKRCLNPKVKCGTPCLIGAATKSEIQTKCHLACGGL